MPGQLAVIPFLQFVDEQGLPRVGAKLFWYLTETTTKQDSYSDRDLETTNPNPMILNSLGIPGDSNGNPLPIYLDPTKIYRMWLAAADESDPPATSILEEDGIVAAGTGAVTTVAGHAGNPNGSLAGTAATPGVVAADIVYDTENNILYVCTSSGPASGSGQAVWTNVASTIAGAIVFSGVVSPAAISTDQDDYNPTDLSAAATLRLNPSADVKIKSLAGGTDGREITLVNTAAFRIILPDDGSADAGTTTANRFKFADDRDLVLLQDEECTLRYDGVNSRWRLKVPPFKIVLGNAQFVENAAFAVTVGSNAMTIALKTQRGEDPSPSDPVYVCFRQTTVTAGNYVRRKVTDALSLVVPSGGTLGFANNEANLIHFGFLDNAGAVELAVCKDGALWNEDRLVSTTQVGTGSDSATVLYSTNARSNVACRLGGIALITTGATAGQWGSSPTRVSLASFNPFEPFKNVLKSWWRWTCTTTTAIRDAFNASSVTDNGTGDTTLSMAVTLRSADYGFGILTRRSGSNNFSFGTIVNSVAPTSSALRIFTVGGNEGNADDAADAGVVISL